MKYGSVCSGIEAATVAWHPLGWEPVFFSEIEPFPCALLGHYYPTVPNFGDMNQFKGWPDATIDVLVGGTPCQSFSIAGLREGLADPRGNLALTYLAVAARYRPRWVVWENVPGVLSSNGGRDFASFLSGLGQLGYGWAYKVLDAQFFGIPQRRRRVFVVGSSRGWASAAAVLFERESLSGHPAPRRQAWEDPARPIGAGSTRGSGYRNDVDTADNLIAFGGGNQSGPIDIATAVRAHAGAHYDFESETFVAPALTHNPYGDHESREGLLVTGTLQNSGVTHSLSSHCAGGATEDGTGRGVPLIPVAAPLSAGNNANSNAAGRRREDDVNLVFAIQERAVSENVDAGPDGAGFRDDGSAYTLEARTVPQAIAFHARQDPDSGPVTHPLDTDGSSIGIVQPYTLAIRGRGDSHQLEYRQDGTANAILTPNGGRAGIGVGAVAFAQNSRDEVTEKDVADSLKSGGGKPGQSYPAIRTGVSVRRLTPRECERLQGFEDDYTLIAYRGKPAADAPRYKAIGNSMARPVMRWIGERIDLVESVIEQREGQAA